MKEKRPNSTGKIIGTIAIVVIIGIWIVISFIKPNNTQYSFRNTGYFGCMLFYDTLIQMDYNVSYQLTPFANSAKEELVVLNLASYQHLNDEDYKLIESYVVEGGQILVLVDEGFLDNMLSRFNNAQNLLEDSMFYEWKHDYEGVLMFGDIMMFNNMSVSTQREDTYNVLLLMHAYMTKGVIFNEYYLYAKDSSTTLWQVIPVGIKFVLVQIIIVLVLVIFKHGKRFGEAKKYLEESEHSENAYALSVGELFYRAKHYDGLLESFYKDFMDKLGSNYFVYGKLTYENFPEIYKEKSKKDYKRALVISQFMKGYYEDRHKVMTNKKVNKQIKEILIQIQKLEQDLDKEVRL